MDTYEQYRARWEACRGRATYFMPLQGRVTTYEPLLSKREFYEVRLALQAAQADVLCASRPDVLEDAAWREFEARQRLLLLGEAKQDTE